LRAGASAILESKDKSRWHQLEESSDGMADKGIGVQCGRT